MPYKIVKSGNGFKVAKKHGGKTFSKKPLTKKRAIAQLRAIETNTHNEGFNLTGLIESVIGEMENPPGMINALSVTKDQLNTTPSNKLSLNQTEEDEIEEENVPLQGTEIDREQQFIKRPAPNFVAEDGDVNVGGVATKDSFGHDPEDETEENLGSGVPLQNMTSQPGSQPRI